MPAHSRNTRRNPPGPSRNRSADNTYVPTRCSICADDRVREVDALLDRHLTMTEVAERSGLSRSSIYRHSVHRSQVALLNRQQQASLVQVPSDGQRPQQRFHRRLLELIEKTSAIGEFGAAVRDPKLMLSAAKFEAEQIHALARQYPGDPAVVFSDGRDQTLATVAVVLAREISDSAVRARIRNSITAELVRRGIEEVA